MKNSKEYFSFPLIALTYPTNFRDFCDTLMCYCLIEYAKKTTDRDLDEHLDDCLDKWNSKKSADDFEMNNEQHEKILVAAHKLGIITHSIITDISANKKLSKWINEMQNKLGKSANVWINKGFVFDARDGAISENDFKVLCAINSIIGNKTYCRITKDRIRYRVLGYNSKSTYEKNNKGENYLSDRQIGTIIERLAEKKFYSKFTYRNRQTFFSIKIKSNEDLQKVVGNYKIFKAEKKFKDKDASNLIIRQIEELKLKHKGQSSKSECFVDEWGEIIYER